MSYRITLIAAILLIFAGSILANKQLSKPLLPESMPCWECRRIVSLSPSITETLYALGLGDRVVGVTRYCEYPPDVRQKTRVGGYFDPNLEAILTLKPDLVIMLEEHVGSMPEMEKLKLETLVVSHKTIDGIIDSFRAIGRRCGKGPEGRRMAREFKDRLERINAKTQGLPRPRVLFVLDRTGVGRGHLTDVYVAGADDFFDTIIELAGGRNACRVQSVRNPVVSPEGLLWLDPDVIVELARPDVLEKHDQQTILADWNELARIKAVENDRVLMFKKGYACVPGPRLIQLVEDLARALHPKVKWEESDE